MLVITRGYVNEFNQNETWPPTGASAEIFSLGVLLYWGPEDAARCAVEKMVASDGQCDRWFVACVKWSSWLSFSRCSGTTHNIYIYI